MDCLNKKIFWICKIISILFISISNVFATETIVIMRHAEKPAGGLGQITCQGLNRALALPRVLISKFKRPASIFAPDPRDQVNDGQLYYYVRPLATIEPTAIQLTMPVNTAYGFSDTKGVVDALLSPQHHQDTVFVAWEHLMAVVIARDIVGRLHANISIPEWPHGDYDSLYVLTIDWNTPTPTVNFTHDYEGLNNLSSNCPT